MAGIETLLSSGGEIGKQLLLWGVLAEIARRVTEPYLRDVTYLVNAHDPNVILSPADLAQAVVRAVMTEAEAAATAEKSGVNAAELKRLTHLAAGPPGLETVLQMYRRGIVDWGEAGPTKANVANAVATSRIYTYWSDAIKKLNQLPMPAAEAVDGVVENQIPWGTRAAVESSVSGGGASGGGASPTTFYEIMWANGYPPDIADAMFHIRGNPPAPTQLLTLFRRGIIPWTGTGPTVLSVQQGISEGATKDKWIPAYKGLVERYPSEYYVLTFLKDGVFTKTQATDILTKYGYSATVIAGIIGAGTSAAVATYKKLTESVVKDLYLEKTLTRTEAKTMLGDIGFGPDAVEFVLTAWDLTFSFKQTNAALTKVRSLFLAKKIDATVAAKALSAYGIAGPAAAQVLQTWTFERSATVKLLTESQIADAMYYAIMSPTEAFHSLQDIGYTPYDAWVVLSVKAKGPLPTIPKPSRTNSGIGTAT